MHKIKILSVGKTKETWLIEALDEYLKRLTPLATIEFVWAKNDDQMLGLLAQESNAICLDPAGKMFSSEEFAQFFQKQLEENGSRLTLVIGGSDGLPQEIKSKFPLISLSRLTFTHQITRLVLIEQIYRAFEINRGSRYHK